MMIRIVKLFKVVFVIILLFIFFYVLIINWDIDKSIVIDRDKVKNIEINFGENYEKYSLGIYDNEVIDTFVQYLNQTYSSDLNLRSVRHTFNVKLNCIGENNNIFELLMKKGHFDIYIINKNGRWYSKNTYRVGMEGDFREFIYRRIYSKVVKGVSIDNF